MNIEYGFYLSRGESEFLSLKNHLPFAPMIGDVILDANHLFLENLNGIENYGFDPYKIHMGDIILFDSGTPLSCVLDKTYRVYERMIYGNKLIVNIELDIIDNKLTLLDIAEIGKVVDSIDFTYEDGYYYFVDTLKKLGIKI